jgi:hypothetical protein
MERVRHKDWKRSKGSGCGMFYYVLFLNGSRGTEVNKEKPQ